MNPAALVIECLAAARSDNFGHASAVLDELDPDETRIFAIAALGVIDALIEFVGHLGYGADQVLAVMGAGYAESEEFLAGVTDKLLRSRREGAA